MMCQFAGSCLVDQRRSDEFRDGLSQVCEAKTGTCKKYKKAFLSSIEFEYIPNDGRLYFDKDWHCTLVK